MTSKTAEEDVLFANESVTEEEQQAELNEIQDRLNTLILEQQVDIDNPEVQGLAERRRELRDALGL